MRVASDTEPPPGAPPGGEWVEEVYHGPRNFLLFLVFGLPMVPVVILFEKCQVCFKPCCPNCYDENGGERRRVYRAPDGTTHYPRGRWPCESFKSGWKYPTMLVAGIWIILYFILVPLIIAAVKSSECADGEFADCSESHCCSGLVW